MENTGKNKIIEFKLLDVISIRLINPSEADVKVITKKFEIVPQVLANEPDIVITYVKKIDLSGLTHIGLNTAAYSKDGFYILSNGKENVKIKVPIVDIGRSKLNMVCESDSPDIPALNYIINFTLIGKDLLPLHATAFRYNDVGAVVMGWSKGGKTESLFSFMNHGAEFLSDEVAVVSSDGKEVLGMRIPICVWEWQFKEIHSFMPKVSLQKKLIMKGIHVVKTLNKIFHIEIINKAMPVLDSQLNIKTLPTKLFKQERIISRMNLDVIILAMSHDLNEIIVEPISADEVIDRMINSQEYELEYFFRYYKMFKYAFPYHLNEFLENIKSVQYALMKKLLEGKKAFVVKHPYPVSFERLFDKMRPIFSETEVNESDGKIKNHEKQEVK